MEDEDLEFFSGQRAQAASFLGNLDERGISLLVHQDHAAS